MTVAEASKLSGVDRARALDELDADGIDRLTEDEPTAEDYETVDNDLSAEDGDEWPWWSSETLF